MFTELVIHTFLSACEQHADRQAFCIADRYYSYADLQLRIAEIAQTLICTDEQHIGLIANDDLDTYAAILACWICGKAYVPLLPDAPIARNEQIIKQASLVFVFDSRDASVPVSLNRQDAHMLITRLLSATNFQEQPAYIFFTSGSTGIPKGVTITKSNIAHFVDACNVLYPDISHEDRCLQMFDLTFDLSVYSFLIPLLSGACVYTIPKNVIKSNYIFRVLDQYKLTIALMTPSVLNYVRAYLHEISLPEMTYSLFCGEALPIDLVQKWADSVPNARIDNVYGPTEATIFCSWYTYSRTTDNEGRHGILSIGKPMKGTELLILDKQANEAPIGETGELCIGGLQLTPGYINNESLNSTVFFNRPYNEQVMRFYRTGDLAVRRSNGNIDFVGRKDSQVKIEGFRVELSEIEYYAQQAVGDKAKMVALALENETGNVELTLVVEAESIDRDAILKYLLMSLPKYMIPVNYFTVPVFPLNANGKTDKKKITELIRKHGI